LSTDHNSVIVLFRAILKRFVEQKISQVSCDWLTFDFEANTWNSQSKLNRPGKAVTDLQD